MYSVKYLISYSFSLFFLVTSEQDTNTILQAILSKFYFIYASK